MGFQKCKQPRSLESNCSNVFNSPCVNLLCGDASYVGAGKGLCVGVDGLSISTVACVCCEKVRCCWFVVDVLVVLDVLVALMVLMVLMLLMVLGPVTSSRSLAMSWQCREKPAAASRIARTFSSGVLLVLPQWKHGANMLMHLITSFFRFFSLDHE